MKKLFLSSLVFVLTLSSFSQTSSITFFLELDGKDRKQEVFILAPGHTGQVNINVEWKGEARSLILSITGPDGRERSERGPSPVKMKYDITEQHLGAGNKFKIKIINPEEGYAIKGKATIVLPSMSLTPVDEGGLYTVVPDTEISIIEETDQPVVLEGAERVAVIEDAERPVIVEAVVVTDVLAMPSPIPVGENKVIIKPDGVIRIEKPDGSWEERGNGKIVTYNAATDQTLIMLMNQVMLSTPPASLYQVPQTDIQNWVGQIESWLDSYAEEYLDEIKSILADYPSSLNDYLNYDAQHQSTVYEKLNTRREFLGRLETALNE